MALELTYKYELKVGVINHTAVLGHLKSVLNTLANKPEYSKFYIGITNDIEARRGEHQRLKPDYRLMCVIYQEAVNLVESGFSNLERTAINQFRAGIKHPDTKQMLLMCDNGVSGSLAKNTLYVLVK